MSYTNPYGMPQGIAKQVANKLREILVAEIIAINGYAEHIANSNMEDINTVWKNIMEDEKTHYGMVLTLLRKYDPQEYKAYTEHVSQGTGPRSPMQIYTPEYSMQIILNNLRADIKGELEAVILYEPQKDSIPFKDVKEALKYIIDEEKSHTEHLTRILLKYDPDKYNGLT